MSNESPTPPPEEEREPSKLEDAGNLRQRFEDFRASTTGQWIADQKAGLSVCFVALALYLGFYLKVRAHLMPGGSDPHYVWMYARSLVYDHDFNFTNDYKICGDPFGLGRDNGTHHPDNPYYVGPTLFLAPALLLLRAVVTLPPTATPDVLASCRGPVAGLSMAVGCFLGAFTLFLSYRLARRFTTDNVAAVSAALFGWAGLLAAYSGLWPNYSHVFSTFGVAIVAITTIRAWEKSDSWWRWAAVALAIGVGTWQRPPQLLYALVPAVAALARYRHDRKRLAGIGFVLVLGCLLGAVPLLLHYNYLYGSFWRSPMKGPYLHLSQAHPFLMLFAPHGGLFYVTPVAWLAVAGLWIALRDAKKRVFVLPLVVAGALEGFLYAAALDWHGTGTFGARRLTSLTPLFVVLGALFLEKLAAWFLARPQRALVALSLGVAVPMTALTHGMMLGQSRGTIPCCGGASQAIQYGEGTKAFWSIFDDSIGDVAILPASLAFAAWYGVPPNRFRDATEARYYVRDFRTLAFHAQSLSFDDPAVVSEGFVRLKRGANLSRSRARVIFAAEWPHATKLTFFMRSSNAGHLRVGFGKTFGVTWIGQTEIGPEHPEPRVLAVPAGAFGSGIVEMVFEIDGVAPGDVVLERVKFDDEGVY